jgi:hypothetical protein
MIPASKNSKKPWRISSIINRYLIDHQLAKIHDASIIDFSGSQCHICSKKKMYARSANRKKNKISCWCTATEKKYIEVQARKANFSASEYLRELGLKDYLRRPKILPPDVLAFNGLLHQLAASLSLIARKRLDAEELNAFERAELQLLRKDITQLIDKIKTDLLCSEDSTPEQGNHPINN